LPRARASHKREIGFVVRFGRLYQWHIYDRFGERQGLNTADFVVVGEVNGALDTRPKPFAGVAIDQANRQALRARIAPFDPTRHYPTVAVWPDSFEQFETLKAVMVEAGFEYRLMPMTNGGELVDRGGVGGWVQ
jgi:hypothetical protein